MAKGPPPPEAARLPLFDQRLKIGVAQRDRKTVSNHNRKPGEAAGRITALLSQTQRGDLQARDVLFESVLKELRKIASRYMRRERQGHTLQTTALVHEAYLRLVEGAEVDWKGRAHFFSVAATVMRRVLVDHARKKGAGKRGGSWERMGFDEAAVVSENRLEEILAIDELLSRLARLDARMSRIVELRFFAGLTEQEIGEVLAVSTRTVKRDWQMARAWLRAEITTKTERPD